jgi:choline dehydrogenase-like flavoprotein
MGDLIVHGIENLYAAGGSVFPTSGATMLTVNIIAMTVRLADHLRTKLIRAGEMHVT